MTASVLAALERWAEAQPDQLLFSFLGQNGEEGERHSYASFLARVEVLAAHLAARVPEREARVVLALQPGLDCIAALFACARAGLIAVPAPPPASHGLEASLWRISHLAADCGARAILTSRQGAALMGGARKGGAAALDGLVWLVAEDLTEAGPALPRRRHGEVFFLQYTSGSTDQPKGVMVSHANILANRDQVVDHEKPVAVTWLPQHHDMGLIGYYIFIAISGGRTYGFAPATFIQRPALWLETISAQQATATSAPNFAYSHCLRPARIPEEMLDRLDLSSLRFLMAAAEPIRPDVFRDFQRRFARCGLKERSFFVAYGLAENTLAVTNYGRVALALSTRELALGHARPIERQSEIGAAQHLLSCGPALPGNEVRIVDPEARTVLPEHEVGEIWIDGPSKCAGYWNRPEASEETFQARLASEGAAQGWLRTGDLGFLHGGELYVCGRLKDLIILRGQNFYPQDIERAVEETSPALRKGAVAAFAIEEGGLATAAVVAELVGSQEPPQAGAVRAAVRQRLGLELGRISFVPSRSLPKTSSGKLMRFEARRMLLAGEFRILAETMLPVPEAVDEVEQDGIVALLRRYGLNGTEEVSLVEAGVDSFDLVLLMHELREMLAARGARRLGEQLDLRLLQQVTAAEVVAIGENLVSAPDAAIAAVSAMVAEVSAAQIATEQAEMRKDRIPSFPLPKPATIRPPRRGGVLLTGATGFLGPFLLGSLLAQTDQRVQVLIRAADAGEARRRLDAQLRHAGLLDPAMADALAQRVDCVVGDLAQPSFGLDDEAWRGLAGSIDAIVHNAATVNYLFTYERMCAANVAGTNEMLRLAYAGGGVELNHVSTTFIFGWATKDHLYETDDNDEMALLDFGYSQSKWVSEQLVLEARRAGLPTRIFRPALITPAVGGAGANLDITLRLLAFMIKHSIGVDARNQVSFMPADVTAANIVAIGRAPGTLGGTFHVTRDRYANMLDVTDIITARTGQTFEIFPLKAFVPEVIRRCTREDPLFPLLDFLIGSLGSISSMEFKLYDNSGYRAARDAAPGSRADPSMDETVDGILKFLMRHHVI